MKTFQAKKEEVVRNWYVVDATGQTLGRLSTKVASVLKGKHKPIYTPHVDCGDYVIVINAEKIKLTGKKWTDKIYYHHTDYPGGLRMISAKDLMAKKPTEMVEKAIKGMLPKTKLGNDMYRKLFVYAGSDHKHEAQKPVVLEVK